MDLLISRANRFRQQSPKINLAVAPVDQASEDHQAALLAEEVEHSTSTNIAILRR